MSSAPCPDEAAEYRLTALPGNRAAYVLATWGLVSLLPGATESPLSAMAGIRMSW